jgi:hypothetical protein
MEKSEYWERITGHEFAEDYKQFQEYILTMPLDGIKGPLKLLYSKKTPPERLTEFESWPEPFQAGTFYMWLERIERATNLYPLASDKLMNIMLVWFEEQRNSAGTIKADTIETTS